MGIFIGIVPIYGFQTLVAVAIALLFRLNKPLTVACTFISNPLFLPFIIFSSVELGCLLRHGSFQPLTLSALTDMRGHINKEQFFIFVIGSVALGILLGALGAAVAAFVVHYRKSSPLRRESFLEWNFLPELTNSSQVVVNLSKKPQHLSFRSQVYRRGICFLNSGTADSSRDSVALGMTNF